jgi:hypothetical protein
MLHPSTKRLIDKLSEMTRKQRVAWSEGENGTITHDTEGYRVILTPEPHAVLLTDALGKEIESCTPDEFKDETDSAGRPYAAFVADLYREAHRHARGAEKAIHTVLKGLETIEAEPDAQPEIAMDPAELIEDPGDDTDSLPEAYPEVEGQNDMARAVASMADEVNAGASAHEEDEPEDAAPSGLETESEAEAELVMTSDIDDDLVEADIEAAEPDEPALDASDETVEPPAGIEASAILSQYASLLPEQHSADVDEAPATETKRADGVRWPEDENAPQPQGETNMADAAPEGEPEPAPSAPPSSAAFAGFFGSSMGDLSRYAVSRPGDTAETPVPVEPEAAPDPEITNPESEPEAYTPAFTEAAATPEPDQPAQETARGAPTEPAHPPSFSLSGMSSGFGLGSAVRSAIPGSERSAEPAQATPSPDRPRIVIDGTADLPDDLPLSAFDSAPGDAPFAFSDPKPVAEMVAKETAEELAPSRPEEKAFEVPAQSAQPQQAEEPERESPAPKVTTRFNPWN